MMAHYGQDDDVVIIEQARGHSQGIGPMVFGAAHTQSQRQSLPVVYIDKTDKGWEAKQGHGEVKWLAQNHTVDKWQNPGMKFWPHGSQWEFGYSFQWHRMSPDFSPSALSTKPHCFCFSGSCQVFSPY